MMREEGKCWLTAQAQNGRTILSECYCTSPFKVMRPFYEQNRAKVILMTASAGILAGDQYDMRFSVGRGADLTVTGQGYTKLFRCKHAPSHQQTTITVHSGAVLHYLPCPIIPFGGSQFSSQTEVFLSPNCHFVWSDILSCGRVGMGERFAMRQYHSRLVVRVKQTPVFLDHCLITPEEIDYTSVGFFDGYSHMGTLYLYGGDESAYLKAIRNLPFCGKKGASRAREGIVVRALANRGEQIETFFGQITAITSRA